MALAALCSTGFVAVHAQTFPSKAVRIVVPFPAGGAFDVTARILANYMKSGFGQNVIVENRPGGGTVIGTEYVARQPPDGYTMLMIGPSFTSHAVLRTGLSFDTDRDFRAVTQVIGLTMAISVNPSLPVKNMKDLVALAKARPGEVSCGTSGPGTSHHLLLEAVKLNSKIDIVHTPFQGAAFAVPATIGGHVSAVLVNVSDEISFIKSGKLRAIVVTSKRREETLPDVQTAAESGHPELEAINWSGFVAHSGTPANVIARLNAETVKALNAPEVRSLLQKQEVVPTPTTPEEFAALIKSDAQRYRRIIREANVRVE
ncbi:MAG TPA: tripartite tricarboxylate transporter substrate binding protein [Burkholderiales bacterium]|nr:tripartite tricarboxylate transporter substrate binding protein [Burkholderiales bacterium]